MYLMPPSCIALHYIGSLSSMFAVSAWSFSMLSRFFDIKRSYFYEFETTKQKVLPDKVVKKKASIKRQFHTSLPPRRLQH